MTELCLKLGHDHFRLHPVTDVPP